MPKLEEMLKDIIPQDSDFNIYHVETNRDETIVIEPLIGEPFFLREQKKQPELFDYTTTMQYNRTKGRDELYVTTDNYMIKKELDMNDFTVNVSKWLNVMPRSTMGGVFGFTYLMSNFQARRDDLHPGFAKEVDLHEAIHTPDEYETRVRTWHKMDVQPRKYIT